MRGVIQKAMLFTVAFNVCGVDINIIPALTDDRVTVKNHANRILSAEMNGYDCVSWVTPFEKKLCAGNVLIEADVEEPGNDYFPVEKILVEDCRAVRGFLSYPADGRLDSRDYAPRTLVMEWPHPGIVSYGCLSYWMRNMFDGLHIKLGGGNGFNAVLLRSSDGFSGRMLAGNDKLFPPWGGVELCAFTPDKLMTQKHFRDIVSAASLSFVDKVNGKTLGDVSFLRTGKVALPKEYEGRIDFFPAKRDGVPGEFGAFFSMFFKEDKNTLSFTRGAGCFNGMVQPEDSGFTHFIIPSPGELPLGAVALNVKFRDFGKDETVYVSVQDPLSPRRELIGYNFKIPENGELKALLDFPDQIVPPNTSLWIKIWAPGARVTADGKTPRISLLTVERRQALDEYYKYRMFLFKGIFAVASEGGPLVKAKVRPGDTELKGKIIREGKYAGDATREMIDCLDEMKRLWPGDKITGLYYDWIYKSGGICAEGDDIFPKDKTVILERPAGMESMPDWAVAAERNTEAILRVADWWIKNRMIYDGEFGGQIGDDSDLLQQFYGVSLLRSQGVGERIKEACRKLNDLAMKKTFKNGMHILRTDPLHGYEEGINTASIMPLLYYGDPVDFECVMDICRASFKLTVKKADGIRYFRKDNFSYKDMDKPDEDFQRATHFLYLHPFCMVAWYNGNSAAAQFVREVIKGLLVCLKDGMAPTFIDVKNGRHQDQAEYKRVLSMFYIPAFLSAYIDNPDSMSFLKAHLTSDELSILRKTAGSDSSVPLWVEDYNGNAASRIARDAAKMEHFEYIHTAAEMFDDRIFMDKRALYLMSLGYNLERNAWAPVQFASYEGFGKGFSAMLLETGNNRLKIALCNSSENAQTGFIRVWRLDNGEYSLTEGPDDNNDNKIDASAVKKTAGLARHSAVPVTLPPRKVWIVEMVQTKKLDDVRGRPDLAMSHREISFDKDRKELSFCVHNIGSKPSGKFKAALFDGERKIQELEEESLEAPADLLPRKKTLCFKNVADIKNLKIVLDPENKVREITKENNSSAVERTEEGLAQ